MTAQRNWLLDPIDTIVDGVIFLFQSGVGLSGYGQKADAQPLTPRGSTQGARGLEVVYSFAGGLKAATGLIAPR